METVAVITAITDQYDAVRRGDVFVDGVTYIFFSDAVSAGLAPGWNHVLLPDVDAHPRVRAKAPKLNPHQFPMLREFDHLIWVDGGILIRSEGFVPELLSHLQDGMVLSPWKSHAHDQIEASLLSVNLPKYEDQPFKQQMAYYQSRGYTGLDASYECGVLARDMRHPVVPELGALWESQMINWSYQDQISLSYCLWRLDYHPAVLPKSFRVYDWIKIRRHNRAN